MGVSACPLAMADVFPVFSSEENKKGFFFF
jgi:hypothetical protein